MNQSTPSYRLYFSIFICLFIGLFSACSTKKNTAFTRFYQGFTTQYNVYYNGENAFLEAYDNLINNYEETYSRLILPNPIIKEGIQQEASPKTNPGGNFDRSLEKGRKAIQEHSIRTKPEYKGKDKNSPKIKAFLHQTEYNPVLYKAWFLVGKSEFFNGDFLQAVSTFSYIARLYASQPKLSNEARAWQARCYAALGWCSEGLTLLHRIKNSQDSLFKKNSIYNTALSELLFRDKQLKSIAQPLSKAIQIEKNKKQKARLYYLLGEVYQANGLSQEAIKSYKKVIRLNPPFKLDFAAHLRKIQLEELSQPKQLIKRMERMKYKEKYRSEIDVLALTIGEAYLALPDTTKAIEAFTLGADSSVTKKEDYALCLLQLGDIYMQKHLYLLAQPCYQKALSGLENTMPRYDSIQTLAQQLQELSSFAQAIQEQDSLQQLALLPKSKLEEHINKAIAEYKKAEKIRQKEEALRQAKEEQKELNDANPDPSQQYDPRSNVNNFPSSKEFYFYNPSLIEIGKKDFEKKWGKRRLEDHWRRRKKALQTETDHSSDKDTSDSVKKENKQDEKALPKEDNPLEKEYWLKNIPFTKEAKEASDSIIAHSLDQLGSVMSEKMEAYTDAVYAFNRLLAQYPLYPNRLSVIYKLYLIAQRIENKALAEKCILLAQQDFPKNNLTQAISDPDYIHKLKAEKIKATSLYEHALQAYFSNQKEIIQENAKLLLKDYPNSDLIPRILFLEALSYANEQHASLMQKKLQELKDKYPSADATEIATSILEELLKGKKPLKSEYHDIYSKYPIFVERDKANELSSQLFHKKDLDNASALILLFPSNMMSIAQANYLVNLFNFSKFTNYNLETTEISTPKLSAILIEGFSQNTLQEYLLTIYSKNSLLSLFGSNTIVLPIDKQNIEVLKTEKNPLAYFQFSKELLSSKKKYNPAISLVELRYKELQSNIEKKPAPISKEASLKKDSTAMQKESISKIEPQVIQIFQLDHKFPALTAFSDTAISTSNKDLHKYSYEDAKALYEKRIREEEIAKKERLKKKKLEQENRNKELKKRKIERETRQREREKLIKNRKKLTSSTPQLK